MGLFDKLKNVFMEDDFDDDNETTRQIPKKELKIDETSKEINREEKEEKPIIKQIEKDTETVSDRSLFDTKDNFKFPIIFEEDDFEEEKKKTKSINVLERANTKYEIKETKPQKFKPSPVISPVYGVLDKNYSKEDIVAKDGLLSDSSLDIDKVIQKAYGNEKKVVITREEKKTTELEKNAEPVIEHEVTETISVVPNVDEKIEEIENEDIKLDENLTIEELDKKIKSIDDLLNETTDDDFYSLVDSMYQDKEEE